jgi:hypothetical protein
VSDKGALHVDEAEGSRWNLALELLGSGETIIFREVSLTKMPECLRILVDTAWKTEQTPARAREDIARAERVVQELLASNEDFVEAVGGRPIEYHAIDDYGMGAIWLAELRDDEFTWTGPPYDE